MAELTATHEPSAEPPNPYVGPQQFDERHTNYYFGRDREARDLLSVVIAHRLVLFYAPSGAGKSSLLKVRLIPGLRSKDVRYLVLPMARMGGVPPAEAGEIDNIFAFNVMSSIDGRKEMAAVFAHMTLKDFMRGLRTSDGKSYSYDAEVSAAAQAERAREERGREERAHEERAALSAPSRRSQPPHVLILDQFEEIVTTHPTRWPEREKFFEQINEALQDDPQLWVVLSMRSDFVSEVERYAPQLPNYAFVRFAMERMGKAAAYEAVAKPAAQAGRVMAPDAVEEVVRNLLLVREQGQEGKAQGGEFVQPVQLQVVCYQMWESLQDKVDAPITIEDLQALAGGDLTKFVDNALGDFYEDRMHQALKLEGVSVSEAELRIWFSDKLITEAGTRGFLNKGKTETEHMPNQVVQFLEDKYLLRLEAKAGAYWYELVHDRFIEPIRARNRTWLSENAQPLVLAAREWLESGKSLDKLLKDDELEKALARSQGQRQTPEVEEFLEICQSEQERRHSEAEAERTRQKIEEAERQAAADRRLAEEQRVRAEAEAKLRETETQLREQAQRRAEEEKHTALRLGRLNQRLTIAIITALALFGLAAGLAVYANNQKKEAIKQADIAKTNEQAAKDNEEIAVDQKERADDEAVRAGNASKYADALRFTNESLTLASRSREFELADQLADRLLLARAATSVSTTVHAQGALLSALDTGYRLNGKIAPFVPFKSLDVGSEVPLHSLAFSPDGRLLAFGDRTGSIWLWDNVNGGVIGDALQAHSPHRVYDLAFNSTGLRLASASGDRDDPASPKHSLILWDLSEPTKPISRVLAANLPSMWSLDFSPDGNLLAVGGQDGAVSVWNFSARQPTSRILPGRHSDWAYSVAFDADGKRLASGGKDGKIILWSDLSSGEPIPQTLSGHDEKWVNDVAFSRDGNTLASGSDDGTIKLWHLSAESPTPALLDDHAAQGIEAWEIAFSPDGKLLAAGWGDGMARIYNLENMDAAPWELFGRGEMWEVAFDPTKPRRLISLSDQDTFATSWDLSASSEFASVQPLSLPMTFTLQAINPDGRWLAGVGADGWVYLTDMGSASQPISVTASAGVKALAVDAGGGHVAIAACVQGNQAQQQNSAEPIPAPSIITPKPVATAVVQQSAIATPTATPTPKAGATAEPRLTNCQLDIWRVAGPAAKLISTIVFDQPIRALAFHPQFADILVLGLDSGAIEIRSLSTEAVTNLSADRVPGLVDLAFSSDGALLAALGKTGLVKFWRWSDHEFLLESKPAEDREQATSVQSEDIAFVQGNRWVAIASSQPEISLWEWRTSEFVATFALDAHVDDLTVDAEQRLVSLQPDGVVRWSMDQQQWWQLACARADRNLSYQAWRTAYPRDASFASARICNYPLDITFAEAKIDEAAKLINDCKDPQLQKGMSLLTEAAALPVEPPLQNFDVMNETIRVLTAQAFSHLGEGSAGFDELANDCLTLAAQQLAAAGKPGFESAQALEIGKRLVRAKSLFDDPQQTSIAEAVEDLEWVLGRNDAWPGELPIAAQTLLAEGYLRLCQQGDAGACADFRKAAVVMKYGETVSGKHEPGQLDSFYFFGKEGDLISVAMNARNDAFDTLVKLQGPGGVERSDDDSGPNNNSLIEFTLPQDGPYRIIPTDCCGGKGAYQLSLRGGRPRTLILGQPMTSTTQTDAYWYFTGEPGQAISLTLESTAAGFDPYLILNGPDGAFLKDDEDSGDVRNALIAPFILPVSGRYLVKTLRPDAVPNADPYTLTLTILTPPELDPGKPVTSTTLRNTLWTFEGRANQIIDISLTSSDPNAFNPYLVLYDAVGKELYRDEDSGGNLGARIQGYFLPADGRYFIQAGGPEASVPYELVWAEAAPPTIALGEPQTSTTRRDALWAFEGRAGQALNIAMTTEDAGFDPYLILFSVDGKRLVEADDAGGTLDALISAFILPQTGTYYIQTGRSGSNSAYQLLVTEVIPKELAVGSSSDSTTRNDPLWVFSARAGQVVDIAMTTPDTSVFDPYLTLFSSDGGKLVESDDVGGILNALISTFVLPQTGVYYIQAGRGDSTAPYHLSVTSSSAQSLALNSPVRVERDGVFTFAGRPGQLVNLTSNVAASLTLVGAGGILADHAPAILAWLDVTTPYTVAMDIPDGSTAMLRASVITSDILPLSFDRPATGELAARGMAVWALADGGATGVEITVAPTAGNLDLQLFAPGGAWVASSTQANRLLSALPTPGEYLLLVRPQTTAAGAYTITATPAALVQGPQKCRAVPDYGPIHAGSIVILGRHSLVNGSSNWNEEMQQYVGRSATVVSLLGTDGVCPVVQVDIDSGRFPWRIRNMLILE